MKVTQLRLAGRDAWPELAIEPIGPELNVLVGLPKTGKSTVARLAAHLLYGKARREQPGPPGQPAPLVEGSIEVDSPQGKYLLRRHRDGSPHGRLSIASTGGAPVDSQTIRSLLWNISPRVLGELYAVDFAHGANPALLLEGEFAHEFRTAISAGAAPGAAATACEQHSTVGTPACDRRQVDELVRRRDETVRRLEEQLAQARRNSSAAERELVEVDAALAARRRQVEPLQAKLRTAEAKLAEIAATLRYFSLESAIRRGPQIDSEAQREAIDRLDAEIARCRQTLGDLQLRDATVRRELAEVHPDGTADSASCLADQRATVGVFERLLEDLDAEVAQLARSHQPGRCIGCDSHARISPVAQMLRQQLYTLCGQVTEQERTVRRMQLHAEARQLARAQTDLSEQLEHLLGRRQSLVHEAQLAQRPAVVLPQPPAAAHCQCAGHGEFVRTADAMQLARTDRGSREQAAHARRLELERERDELRAACDAVQQELQSLEARGRQLQRDRAEAAEAPALDELRRELERLEGEIHLAMAGARTDAAGPVTASPHRLPWKASDILAQLSDGELAQIRLNRDGQGAAIIGRDGAAREIGALPPAQRDQLYVALTLALVSSFAHRGVDLPLILDEPFLRQDARGAAAMAGVLAEFARLGRQALVLTQNRDAVRRFDSLGVATLELDALRRQPRAVSPWPTAPVPIPQTPAEPVVRIVRETVDERVPKLRVTGASPWADEPREVYFLTLGASIADFPVLGNDTAKVFRGLDIHTVEDLLAADAAAVAGRLQRPGVTAKTVRLWQAHMSLMCFVPGVSLNDAQVLAACDVNSPDAVAELDPRVLAATIERFLATDRGRRFTMERARYTPERLAETLRLARSQRPRWLAARGRFNWLDRAVQPASEPAGPAAKRSNGAKPTRATVPHPSKRTQRRPLQFMLELNSPVAKAPSIDSACAERLGAIGVRTVADLLNANPESAAEEIGEPRLSAVALARWQCEARLACRIPELRCSGAQLLAATGYTQPEQVAGADAGELYKKVRGFCRTPQGKRLVGDGKSPSRERVAQWIRHAAFMRPLEAA